MLRRLIQVLFLVFVFSSTFSISLSQLSLGVCAALFVVAALREHFNPLAGGWRWFWSAVVVYISWLVVVCLLQADPLRAFDHIREEWLFIVVPIGVFLGRDRRFLDRVVPVLAIGLLVVSLASLLMYASGVQYDWGSGFTPLPETNPRVRGNFAHALTFGNYAAVASAFLLAWALTGGEKTSGKTKTLAIGTGVVGLVAVLLCGSRGPVLAFLVGMAALLIFVTAHRRRWILALLAALLVVGLLVPSVRSRFGTELGWHFNTEWAGGRLFIWSRSLEIVADHPLTGVGPGNFAVAYRQQLDPEVTSRYWYEHAHNDFLEAAARSGLPGMVTFALLWFVVLHTLWRGRKRVSRGSPEYRILSASLVGSLVFLAASMTEAAFADEEVRALLMVIWAIGLAAGYKNEDEAAESGAAMVS